MTSSMLAGRGLQARHGIEAVDETKTAADDSGETLVELLMSLTLIGIAVIAIVSALAAGIRFSDVHRKQAIAGTLVSAYAESVDQAVKASGYQASCTPTYASTFAVPTGYAKSVVAVSFFTGTAFQTTCSTAGDIGIQRLTLQIASADGRASERLVVVVRKPCRTTDAVCT